MANGMDSTGINRSDAEDLFQNYHNSPTHSNSQGLLKVLDHGTEKAIIHFSLGYEEVIKPLKEKVDRITGIEFLGIAGIPAYNSNESSHTIIWVAVIKKEDGKTYYFLPPDNESTDETYIYDHSDICPVNCPENVQRLWKDDWAE